MPTYKHESNVGIFSGVHIKWQPYGGKHGMYIQVQQWLCYKHETVRHRCSTDTGTYFGTYYTCSFIITQLWTRSCAQIVWKNKSIFVWTNTINAQKMSNVWLWFQALQKPYTHVHIVPYIWRFGIVKFLYINICIKIFFVMNGYPRNFFMVNGFGDGRNLFHSIPGMEVAWIS